VRAASNESHPGRFELSSPAATGGDGAPRADGAALAGRPAAGRLSSRAAGLRRSGGATAAVRRAAGPGFRAAGAAATRGEQGPADRQRSQSTAHHCGPAPAFTAASTPEAGSGVALYGGVNPVPVAVVVPLVLVNRLLRASMSPLESGCSGFFTPM